MRHMGREYGLVLSGRLRVTIGFDEEHELGPGDSIAFESRARIAWRTPAPSP